jgi:hypothetical protein
VGWLDCKGKIGLSRSQVTYHRLKRRHPGAATQRIYAAHKIIGTTETMTDSHAGKSALTNVGTTVKNG